MANQYKICRVCGKQYEACRSRQTENSSFHWKEVACSPECGVKYLEAVMRARSPLSVEEDAIAEVVEEDIIEIEEFNDDEDDEDGYIDEE